MFQGNDYIHPVKLCTAFLNMAIFVNRPPQKVQLKLSGDAHIFKFEISLVESAKDDKNGGEDSDPEESEQKPSKHDHQSQPVETTELQPNPELQTKNQELEREFGIEQQKGMQHKAELEHLHRKLQEEESNHARSQD